MNAQPIIATQSLQPAEISQEDKALVKEFIWKNCTDSQLKFALATCQRFGFDPLLKHVAFISGNIYTTRDGLLHLAHSNPHFNGMQSGVVYQKDCSGEFIRNEKGHKQLDGAWARVYRKDMEYPFSVEVDFNEYNKGSGSWQSNPGAMILKVAEHMALKRAFNVGGLASVEEIGQDDYADSAPIQQIKQDASSEVQALKDQKKLKTLMAEIKQIQSDNGLTKLDTQHATGLETLSGLDVETVEKAVSDLKEYVRDKNANADFERQMAKERAQ